MGCVKKFVNQKFYKKTLLGCKLPRMQEKKMQNLQIFPEIKEMVAKIWDGPRKMGHFFHLIFISDFVFVCIFKLFTVICLQ